MTANQGTSPHIRDEYTPLQELAVKVFQRYGDYAVSAIDGATLTMFLDLANLVIEEVNDHPYWQSEPLDYYGHPTEARPVPDLVMQNGLLFHYALQQASPKIEIYSKVFYKTMNTLLWRRINGGKGSQPLRFRVVDGGSSKRHSPATSPLTGQQINTDE